MNSSVFLCSVAAAVGFTFFRKFRFRQDNKDTKSSSLSLPSPPTSVPRIWKHHVFPSFHGADVRRTFLSHIQESFNRKGIDTFIDNNIKRSKSIGLELLEAINGSKIAIVLLSKNYASSSWCLDELVEIMKCREALDQIVMPIFYEVDPTEIRKQTGDFGKAFRKTCKGKTKENIERWRKALGDVATIAGEHSRNCYTPKTTEFLPFICRPIITVSESPVTQSNQNAVVSTSTISSVVQSHSSASSSYLNLHRLLFAYESSSVFFSDVVSIIDF